MATFHNYDPKRVVGSFRGIPILGFAEGTFIAVERAEDGFETSVGSAGDVTRVRNNNRVGTVTFTLKQESPSNSQLSSVAIEDERFGTGFGPLLVKDVNGTSIFQATVAWVKKFPSADFSDSAGTREWVIECAELEIFVGSGVF